MTPDPVPSPGSQGSQAMPSHTVSDLAQHIARAATNHLDAGNAGAARVLPPSQVPRRPATGSASHPRSVSPGDPERRQLPAATFTLLSPDGSRLTVQRSAKAPHLRSVRVDLLLHPHEGPVQRDLLVAYVNRDDRDFEGRCALGYSVIDLGGLCGHSTSPALHLALAQAGEELGVEIVGVTGVVNPGFGTRLMALGMEETSMDTYEATPAELKKACSHWLASRGWQAIDA